MQKNYAQDYEELCPRRWAKMPKVMGKLAQRRRAKMPKALGKAGQGFELTFRPLLQSCVVFNTIKDKKV